MTFDPARPRYTLPLAGREYDLVGTMELIEAVEYALKRGVTQAAVDAAGEMPSGELAKLLSAVLSASGHPLTPADARALLWEKVGLAGDANQLLRVHLYSFLSVCLAPPEQREAKKAAAGELLGRLGSPGGTTSSSASAS